MESVDRKHKRWITLPRHTHDGNKPSKCGTCTCWPTWQTSPTSFLFHSLAKSILSFSLVHSRAPPTMCHRMLLNSASSTCMPSHRLGNGQRSASPHTYSSMQIHLELGNGCGDCPVRCASAASMLSPSRALIRRLRLNGHDTWGYCDLHTSVVEGGHGGRGL